MSPAGMLCCLVCLDGVILTGNMDHGPVMTPLGRGVRDNYFCQCQPKSKSILIDTELYTSKKNSNTSTSLFKKIQKELL